MNTTNNKGFLVLIGGAEDKKDGKSILKHILSLKETKTIAVIPSASSYPTGLAEDYVHAFKSLGVENIVIFDIRNQSEADKQEYLDICNKVDLFFFTGGDQVKLVNILNNTKLIEKIKTCYQNGATIAGTSAGAAAASNPMIFDGDYHGLVKGSIRHADGFGLIENITIDTHFVNRGRIGRLTQFLCSGISTRGIGLGEDTGIVVHPDNKFDVIGSEMVTVVNTEYLTYNNFDYISNNEAIVLNGIRVGFLQPGCTFNLKTWNVEYCKSLKNHLEKIKDSKPLLNS